MKDILQDGLPEEMLGPVRLPGVGPCAPLDWFRLDEAYASQMAYRRQLLQSDFAAVHGLLPSAEAAAQEVLREALAILPSLGFEVSSDTLRCPDGHVARLRWDAPLLTLGTVLQEDFCILEKQGEEHVLTGAVLCFPAGWALAEKLGRPLVTIHDPVEPYDADLARRVQRLFDGVRVGHPLWRFNRLHYAEAELFQPYRETRDGPHLYTRSERQCIVRMPQTRAVVFSIHTYVVRAGQGPKEP